MLLQIDPSLIIKSRVSGRGNSYIQADFGIGKGSIPIPADLKKELLDTLLSEEGAILNWIFAGVPYSLLVRKSEVAPNMVELHWFNFKPQKAKTHTTYVFANRLSAAVVAGENTPTTPDGEEWRPAWKPRKRSRACCCTSCCCCRCYCQNRYL